VYSDIRNRQDFSAQIMGSQFRFVFVVLCFTALLTLTVYLRSEENRILYRVCAINVEQSRQRQLLWQRQIMLENLTNPAAVSKVVAEAQERRR
jgi:hypothetical protein